MERGRCVDDHSRLTKTLFLVSKDKSCGLLLHFLINCKENDSQLASTRSDHGTQFKNARFLEYYVSHDNNHNFSAFRISQQNGVILKKIIF